MIVSILVYASVQPIYLIIIILVHELHLLTKDIATKQNNITIVVDLHKLIICKKHFGGQGILVHPRVRKAC